MLQGISMHIERQCIKYVNSYVSNSRSDCLCCVTTNKDTTGKDYISLAEGTFKKRFTQHKQSFRNQKYANSTELSKYIWELKDKNKDYNIQWTIITSAKAYNNISKRCDLCLTEKLHIMKGNKDSLLNKRSEMISKCRHENKFYLMNNRTLSN